jgi:hypothetical protein
MYKADAYDIDVFKRFLHPGTNSLKIEERQLLGYLETKAKKSDQYNEHQYKVYNRVFKNILKNPSRYKLKSQDGYESEGVFFPGKTINYSLMALPNRHKQIADMQRTKSYNINGTYIDVTIKADYIYGNCINKIVALFKGYEYSKYHHSMEWAFALDIFELDQFNYLHFAMNDGTLELKENTKSITTVFNGDKTDTCTIDSFFSISKFQTYDNLYEDKIEPLLKEFVDYIKLRKLEKFFDNQLTMN